MILTGKCKEDFGLFLVKEHKIADWEYFYSIKEILKNALIIDFFDSVGIYILIKKTIDVYWFFDIQFQGSSVNISAFEPMQEIRQEAKNQAIIKANEIYNNLNK